MRIQLLLPSVPGFSIRNVVLAVYSSYSYLRNFFTGFIVNHFFSNKTPLFIEGAKSFLSAPDEKTEKLTSVIRAIARDNQDEMFVGTSVTGLFFFPKGERVACRKPLNMVIPNSMLFYKKGRIINFVDRTTAFRTLIFA